MAEIKAKKKKKNNNKNKSFDKYWYYKKSVQSPDVDVEFFLKTYNQLKGKNPTTFREDFCGSFALSCEWVRLKAHHQAIAVDLNSEPLNYGRKNYLCELKKNEANRISIHEKNVLDPLPGADIISASNFSYFIFKKREVLKKYFTNCFKKLHKDGIFILDCFGGSQCYEPNEEETKHSGFSYFWDQDSFDPITNEAQFYIHFKIKGQKKMEKAFSYDWRIWSIPELRDLLREVGFEKVHVYWEGTDEDGQGDGEFSPTDRGEDCESWVAYIVSEK